MRAAPPLAFAASLLALACSSNAGRQPLPPAGTPPPVPEELVEEPIKRYPRLLPLRGVQVQMGYVPGSLDRAEHVRRRLEAICEALNDTTKAPLALHGFVLDREEWDKAGLGEWGLPARLENQIWAVAAEGDPATVRRTRELTGGWLPLLGGEPLRGTAEEAASLLVGDAILQVGVVREFAAAQGLHGSEPWVDAFLVQLAARLAWETTDPGQMAGVALLWDRFALQRPGQRRLADYRYDLPLEDELAWQADLLRGADLVWVDKGPFGTRHYLKKWIRRGEPITPADLDEDFPDLAAWRRATFAD